MSTELSEITLQLAGAVGACGLSVAAASPGALATVDQHAAEVRDALADHRPQPGPTARVLLGYARGFVEAAMGRGWLPVPGVATDWESMRLAAVCQLITQSQAPLG